MYYYNPQGNELEKNMIGFAKGEKLNLHGIQSYKKAIASAWGLDKATDEDKLLWFIDHQDKLDEMRSTAKEPHTYDALMYGWKQHLNGEPVNVPIEFDATNSFAQFAAVLLKDEDIAKTCNVINTVEEDGTIVISDLYQLIADEMSRLIAEQ
jgi:DNA-directed RNA polymerase